MSPSALRRGIEMATICYNNGSGLHSDGDRPQAGGCALEGEARALNSRVKELLGIQNTGVALNKSGRGAISIPVHLNSIYIPSIFHLYIIMQSIDFYSFSIHFLFI